MLDGVCRTLAIAIIATTLGACGSGEGDATTATDTARSPARPTHRAEFEAVADRLEQGDNEFFGRGRIDTWRQVLQATDLPPERLALGRASLAHDLLKLGLVDDAVAEIEAAATLAATTEMPLPSRLHLLRMQGLVALRQAEVENCVARHNRECCIFPLRGGGVHTDTAPAARARVAYEAYLRASPGDVRTAWLLNVVAMALGDHPDAVPEPYRISPETLRSDDESRRVFSRPFTDRAPELGVATFNQCGGVIADDVDGDGLLDVITSTFDPRGPLAYYRNRGDGTFEDRSAASRLDDQLGGLNIVGADYDGDGDVDILVLRGAWMKDDGRIRNSLLRNDGGVFVDVTEAAGLLERAPAPTQAAAWGDFDNDGDLDLYVVTESRREIDGVSYPARLWRNDGDGTFTDIATAAGVTNDRYGKGVTAGDYDGDGDLDLYVSNFGVNRLYRNNGDATFVDVALELGVTEPRRRSFATWFFDHDNDGDLDLFVTAYDATIADVAADVTGRPHEASTPRLYRNEGNGMFTNVTAAAGLDRAWLPMGANFGDADNDGWLDVYLTTGEPNYEALMPNVLMRNDAGRRFLDATEAAGLGHLQKGHGVAFADFDHDGDQDVYHQLGGFYPGDRFHNALFENPGHGHRFLAVELVGTESNRQGIGTRLRVTVRGPSGTRAIHRAAGSVSSFGGSPRRQEIGLGRAEAIETLEVWWPTSGQRQRFTGVPLDGFVRVTEGRPDLEVLDRRSLTLGGL